MTGKFDSLEDPANYPVENPEVPDREKVKREFTDSKGNKVKTDKKSGSIIRNKTGKAGLVEGAPEDELNADDDVPEKGGGAEQILYKPVQDLIEYSDEEEIEYHRQNRKYEGIDDDFEKFSMEDPKKKKKEKKRRDFDDDDDDFDFIMVNSAQTRKNEIAEIKAERERKAAFVVNRNRPNQRQNHGNFSTRRDERDRTRPQRVEGEGQKEGQQQQEQRNTERGQQQHQRKNPKTNRDQRTNTGGQGKPGKGGAGGRRNYQKAPQQNAQQAGK